MGCMTHTACGRQALQAGRQFIKRIACCMQALQAGSLDSHTAEQHVLCTAWQPQQAGSRTTRLQLAHHQMRKAGNVQCAVLTELAQACNVKAAKLCQLGQAFQAVQPVTASEAEALHRGARCRQQRRQLSHLQACDLQLWQ